MINTLVSCFVNTLPLPFPSSVSQHGHSDGSVLAMPTEHIRSHSFPSTDMDCWDVWHHTISPDCLHVLLVC